MPERRRMFDQFDPVQRQVFEALRHPGAYSSATGIDHVDVLQTHISVLFFAGDRVYKLKKAVDLGFLDFSTLERRQHFCEEEIRLNRRLAPQTYLGMEPITRDPDGVVRINGAGETIEYAVVMRRLPAERMLDQLIEHEQLNEHDILRLARTLAHFHREARTDDEVSAHGTPDAVLRKVMRNLDEIEPFVHDDDHPNEGTLVRPVYELLRVSVEQFVETHRVLMTDRVASGRIREGHGDLHAGNICVLEDRLVIYDCIEFSFDIRCQDVACDLAFLLMDFEYRSRPDLAQALLEAYIRDSGDAQLVQLLDLYQPHLACVRGKVASITATNAGDDHEARERSNRSARRYFNLAAGYVMRPVLVIMCGLPGTGKSTVARALTGPLNAEMHRSDAVRKKLAGLAPHDRTGAEHGMYSKEWSRRVYDELAQRAAAVLTAGRSVILDATYASQESRAQAIDIARAVDRPWVVVHVTAEEQTIIKHMKHREQSGADVSDADIEVYHHVKRTFEPPNEIARDHLVTILIEDDEDQRASVVITSLARQAAATASTP